jgi:hypothetical protein
MHLSTQRSHVSRCPRLCMGECSHKRSVQSVHVLPALRTRALHHLHVRSVIFLSLVKSLVYTPTFDRHIANCPGILHAKSIEGLPFTGEYYPYNLPYLHTLYASNSCCNMISVSDDFFPFRSAVKRSGLTFDANTWLLPQFYPSLQYLYARGLL